MVQLTSAKTAPYLIALSTDFSVDPLISGEYSFSNPSSSCSDERRASTYMKNILAGEINAQWKRYEWYQWQRIVLLESHYAFQSQQPLSFLIRSVGLIDE